MTEHPPVPNGQASELADPFLALSADVVDDAESNRIANENRLRQLTRTEVDKDGVERGFGLDESHPDVAVLAGLVDMLRQVEHQATLQLNRKMRAHPLGPWAKAQRGIGEKQLARLLATIGDPYWNTLHNRPRTVSELWAYCGYHTLPASHARADTQMVGAGGEVPASQTANDAHRVLAGGDTKQAGGVTARSTDAGGDQRTAGTHNGHVAARRKRGVQSNWSEDAKMRAFLIAESCMKAGGPYREVYDKRKAATEGRTHVAPCVRCGPSGTPAKVGSEWSAGHRHADALRITAKTILRDLWREARRVHEESPT